MHTKLNWKYYVQAAHRNEKYYADSLCIFLGKIYISKNLQYFGRSVIDLKRSLPEKEEKNLQVLYSHIVCVDYHILSKLCISSSVLLFKETPFPAKKFYIIVFY